MTERPLVCSCGVLLYGASYDVYNATTGDLLGVYCSAQCPDLRRGTGGGRRDEPALTAHTGRGSLAGTQTAEPAALGGASRLRARPERRNGRIRIPGKTYTPPPPFPWDAA
jgi:hypothetical protein